MDVDDDDEEVEDEILGADGDDIETGIDRSERELAEKSMRIAEKNKKAKRRELFAYVYYSCLINSVIPKFAIQLTLDY